MSAKLRVGNLGLTINAEKLKKIFGQFGTVVDAEISFYELTGRPRGFGFVEMSSREEAAECISRLNGREQEGRDLDVTSASLSPAPRRLKRGVR